MNINSLEKLGACEKALEWAKQQKSRGQAWQDCKRGDWMLWLLGHLSGPPDSESRRKLVLCACECARLALKHVPKHEKRPLVAIEIAEAYCRGEASLRRVRDAADAAYANADAAYANAAYAAYAAAYAATRAAYAATRAAYVAARAAYVAAYVAYDVTLSRCADIVRKHYPKAPILRTRKNAGGI